MRRWSAPLLFAYSINRFSMTWLILYLILIQILFPSNQKKSELCYMMTLKYWNRSGHKSECSFRSGLIRVCRAILPASVCNAAILSASFFLFFVLIWVLQPVKIISLILSQVNHQVGENGRFLRKTTWPPASRTWLVSRVARATLYATSFRRRFFACHHAMTHTH